MTCASCKGSCPTPQACELPVARATKPPRVAFMLLALLRPARAMRVALLNWELNCVRDERAGYEAAGAIGPIYHRNSLTQQRELMTRIRELEAQP